MRRDPHIHRFIDPGDALGEVMFGIIMTLTFTVGARYFMVKGEFDTNELIVGAVGCNIAWGIIDAFLYLLGALYERRRSAGAGAAIGLTLADGRAALLIFVLVVLTAVPAALPFLFVADSYVALRVSNALMTVLLFGIGYCWGKHVGARPVVAGMLVMSIGIVLVLVAIPLGG